VTEFNSVAADGRATYLLSFTPPEAADGKYHLITMKLAGRKDVTLRYRTGYFYRASRAPSRIGSKRLFWSRKMRRRLRSRLIRLQGQGTHGETGHRGDRFGDCAKRHVLD